MLDRPIDVLVIAHCFVVPGYRKMLSYLCADPRLRVTLVIPDRWVEYETLIRSQKSPSDSGFDLRIWQPISHRQHSHLYPQLPLYLLRNRPDFILLLEEPQSLITATTLTACRMLCPGAKTAFYTFLNDDRIFAPFPNIKGSLFNWALRTSYEHADIAISATQAAYLQVRKRGFEKKAVVVPFGVDVESLCRVDEAQVAALRRRLAPHDEFVFGFVGRLSPEKGVDLLLRSAATLSRDHAPMRVVIIGDGPEKERLHRLAADLGMREAVAFLGPVPHTEIGQHIRALDALVVPSRRLGDWVEQFGRILLEGMALKVPVIGSTCGEIPNILRECGGLIHDENDSESLSSQMSAVMTMSASDRRLLTMHAAENARARYDYAAVAARYRDLIIAETGRHAATPRACREIPR